MALALEPVGWSNADHWMRLQADYDLAQERRSAAAESAGHIGRRLLKEEIRNATSPSPQVLHT